jgi:hypothetical protein
MAESVHTLGTLYWAKVNYLRPDSGPESNPKDNLQVCFVPDDPDFINGLASEEFPVTWQDPTNEIPENYVRIKTTYIDNPLKVVDAKGTNLPHTLELGNGTRAYVYFTASQYNYGKKARGTKLNLNGLQVVDLVEYVREEEDAYFDEVDGFVYEAAQ